MSRAIATLVCAVIVVLAATGLARAQVLGASDAPSGKLERPAVEAAGKLAPRSSGGPDAAGYVWDDSAEPGGPVYDWVDASATGFSIALGDDTWTSPVAMGFTFTYYGTSFTSLYIGSNGLITFGAGSDAYNNDCPQFPQPGTTPPNIVAPMWDDLDPGTNNDLVWFSTYAAGSCPWNAYAGECMVVEYDDYSHYSSSGAADGDAGTFEVVFLSNGTVVFQYQDVGVEAGGGATVGIGDATATIGLAYSCNSTSLSPSLAVRFRQSATPTPTPGVTPTPPPELAIFIDGFESGTTGAWSSQAAAAVATIPGVGAPAWLAVASLSSPRHYGKEGGLVAVGALLLVGVLRRSRTPGNV